MASFFAKDLEFFLGDSQISRATLFKILASNILCFLSDLSAAHPRTESRLL